MTAAAGFSVLAIGGMPLFQPGMSVAREVAAALHRTGETLRDGDILVVAQKIVSKAEGRIVDMGDVAPGPEAQALARETDRPPAMAQLILDESTEVLRASPAAIITRHRTGHVLANAGIDASNVEGGEEGTVLLWPEDPDASARAIRSDLRGKIGVVIADSMGRAWRIGTCGTAIGVAGLAVLDDRRGLDRDLYGRTLQATVIAIADSIAAAAVLAMGEGAEGTPAALVRGLDRWVADDDGSGAASGIRPIEQDMFR